MKIYFFFNRWQYFLINGVMRRDIQKLLCKTFDFIVSFQKLTKYSIEWWYPISTSALPNFCY